MSLQDQALKVMQKNDTFFIMPTLERHRRKLEIFYNQIPILKPFMDSYSNNLISILSETNTFNAWINGDFNNALKSDKVCQFIIDNKDSIALKVWQFGQQSEENKQFIKDCSLFIKNNPESFDNLIKHQDNIKQLIKVGLNQPIFIEATLNNPKKLDHLLNNAYCFYTLHRALYENHSYENHLSTSQMQYIIDLMSTKENQQYFLDNPLEVEKVYNGLLNLGLLNSTYLALILDSNDKLGMLDKIMQTPALKVLQKINQNYIYALVGPQQLEIPQMHDLNSPTIIKAIINQPNLVENLQQLVENYVLRERYLPIAIDNQLILKKMLETPHNFLQTMMQLRYPDKNSTERHPLDLYSSIIELALQSGDNLQIIKQYANIFFMLNQTASLTQMVYNQFVLDAFKENKGNEISDKLIQNRNLCFLLTNLNLDSKENILKMLENPEQFKQNLEKLTQLDKKGSREYVEAVLHNPDVFEHKYPTLCYLRDCSVDEKTFDDAFTKLVTAPKTAYSSEYNPSSFFHEREIKQTEQQATQTLSKDN